MEIILHCSDSIWGNAAIITKWHVLPKPDGRGWSNIGYHYVILNGHLSTKAFNKNMDGHIETGRPLDDDSIIDPFETGAHTLGHNDVPGICLIGKSGKFSKKQLSSLEYLLTILRQQFKTLTIKQHSDYDNNKKHCAGLDQSYIDELNEIYK